MQGVSMSHRFRTSSFLSARRFWAQSYPWSVSALLLCPEVAKDHTTRYPVQYQSCISPKGAMGNFAIHLVDFLVVARIGYGLFARVPVSHPYKMIFPPHNQRLRVGCSDS